MRAGVGWDEPDRAHHPGPLRIVITRARGLAEMMLLQMRHFVDKRPEALLGVGIGCPGGGNW